jgi:hypothetical protein
MPRPSEFYKIRVARCAHGERFPLLVEADTRLPLIEPNQYVLRAERPTCDVETLETDLRNIGILYAWCHSNGVDVRAHVLDFGCLTNRQLDNLIDDVRIDFQKAAPPDPDPRVGPANRGASNLGRSAFRDSRLSYLAYR